MNLLASVWMAVMVVIIFTPLESVLAQTPGKKPLPQVPIIYPGDTAQSISRRAQWIEIAKKEKEMIWWGTGNPTEAYRTLTEFNRIYPFIKATFWHGGGEESAAKFEAQSAGNRSVDVMLGGEQINYFRWRKMGLLEKYVDIIPGIATMDKRMYGSHGDFAVPGSVIVVPKYNTKLVSASEAPRSWEDLLDPKWKGQMGLTSDVKGWVTLALAEGGWGVEKTELFLTKLKAQKPLWSSSTRTTHTLMMAGDFKVSAGYLHQILQSPKDAPVGWSKSNPIIMVEGSSFVLQKGAPHPNAARLFLEWLFSQQGLAVFEKMYQKGAAFPGSGTQQAKLLEGLNIVAATEDTLMKSIDLDLQKRFFKALGIAE